MFRATRCTVALLACLATSLSACSQSGPTAPDAAAARRTPPASGNVTTSVTTTVAPDGAAPKRGVATPALAGAQTLCGDATMPWWGC